MAGKTYQSCLAPFENEIIALRRKKPPTPYAKIVEYMQEKHKIKVCRETIFSFLKIRARGFKKCRYAESIELSNAAILQTKGSTVSAKPQTSISSEAVPKVSKQPATEKPTSSQTSESQDWENEPFEMEFSETYNLTRLPPDVAAARNKIIEEKIRAKYYKK